MNSTSASSRKNFFALTILFSCCLLAFPANSATAHKLHVFAWLENDNIIVECNFGNKKPAIDAPVTILDKDTNRALLQGTTDKTGHFTFPVPSVVHDGHTLAIVVNTGDGHRNEWVMPASELYAASSLTTGFDQEATDMEKQGMKPLAIPPAPVLAQMAEPAPVPGQMAETAPKVQTQQVKIPGPEHLRMIIRDEMEQQLAPVRKALAQQASSGPSLTEIIGGLGWIVGIVGIAFFFLSRRKN